MTSALFGVSPLDKQVVPDEVSPRLVARTSLSFLAGIVTLERDERLITDASHPPFVLSESVDLLPRPGQEGVRQASRGALVDL